MATRNVKIFYLVVAVCYATTIVLSYLRIYVFHAYPVYYSEDDMPALTSELLNFPNFLHP